ncbi:hypothetical protein [Thiorhodococcus minor]|uniref:Uncharacterized protein n=1 Tax=Thiorhodococcus minor TaxID=57489 RepID=A0A6M0K2J7_9GAMM|nr:hypothetical protein [Thiorhodococcus minor]NEV63976.1 hypothetical protein [Thiorhodococcus minor]
MQARVEIAVDGRVARLPSVVSAFIASGEPHTQVGLTRNRSLVADAPAMVSLNGQVTGCRTQALAAAG